MHVLNVQMNGRLAGGKVPVKLLTVVYESVLVYAQDGRHLTGRVIGHGTLEAAADLRQRNIVLGVSICNKNISIRIIGVVHSDGFNQCGELNFQLFSTD